MARGNQRELAREKAQKKQQQQKKSQSSAEKGNNSGVSQDKRMERDADIMRKKQEKAAAEKAAEEKAGQGSKVVKIDPLKNI